MLNLGILGEAVRDLKPSIISAEIALNNQRVVEAAFRSIHSKQAEIIVY